MTATLFTTRLNQETFTWIDTFSRVEKKTKRQIVEDALLLYSLSQKKQNMRNSFKHIGSDREMMEIAETGLDVLHNV